MSDLHADVLRSLGTLHDSLRSKVLRSRAWADTNGEQHQCGDDLHLHSPFWPMELNFLATLDFTADWTTGDAYFADMLKAALA
jgi:hypothetical protein